MKKPNALTQLFLAAVENPQTNHEWVLQAMLLGRNPEDGKHFMPVDVAAVAAVAVGDDGGYSYVPKPGTTKAQAQKAKQEKRAYFYTALRAARRDHEPMDIDVKELGFESFYDLKEYYRSLGDAADDKRPAAPIQSKAAAAKRITDRTMPPAANAKEVSLTRAREWAKTLKQTPAAVEEPAVIEEPAKKVLEEPAKKVLEKPAPVSSPQQHQLLQLVLSEVKGTRAYLENMERKIEAESTARKTEIGAVRDEQKKERIKMEARWEEQMKAQTARLEAQMEAHRKEVDSKLKQKRESEDDGYYEKEDYEDAVPINSSYWSFFTPRRKK